MAERPDQETRDEEPASKSEGSDDGNINDALTRTDVEAPRRPFGS